MVITGSSGGIGEGVVKELAKEGARLVLQYNKNEQKIKKLVKELNLKSQPLLFKINFAKKEFLEKQLNELVRKTLERFGRIDALVCLAGRTTEGLWDKGALEYTLKDFYDMVDIDVYGTFICSKIIGKQMLKQKKGVIIITGSNIAISGYGVGFGWVFAKAANIGIAKSLAKELAPYVRVNAIAPGNIETEWVKELSQKEREEAAREALVNRFGKPEEIGKLLVYLISDDATFIDGQTIVIDGGAVVR